MSKLHDELVRETKEGACRTCLYLSTLDPASRAEWQAEIALPVEIVGNTALVVALRRRGVSIEEASVRRHRSNHV